jgi:hypothetical protein
VDERPERDELAFAFACEVTGGILTLNDEVDQFAWFTPDTLQRTPRHAMLSVSCQRLADRVRRRYGSSRGLACASRY